MNKKIKIAIIGLKGLPAFGGASSVGESLLNQLRNQYEFYVYSISTHIDHENVNNYFKQIVFSETKINGFATFKYYLRSLFHCLFLSNYDLIHLHHAESGFITPFLRLKYRIIVTFHGIYNKPDPKFGNISNIFFKFSQYLNIKFANKVISVSNVDAKYLNNKYKANINYIPNGVNLVMKNLNRKPDNIVTFAAGRIYDIKGLHLILKAMHKNNFTFRLRVIGNLNQVASYKIKIEELSETLNVEFCGLLKDKKSLFEEIQKSMFFIFPSVTEAMSMMLLEVAALKVPIIASNIPANTSIFTEDEILFFKNKDVDDLSKKINYALSNLAVLSEKADNAYIRIQKEYNWASISQMYNNYYNLLIK